MDLVLIHWPVKGYVQETWQVMEDYVNKGLIKSIGLSNFNPHHIDELLTYAKLKPVLNQIENHPNLSQWRNPDILLPRVLRLKVGRHWPPGLFLTMKY
ncbi:aldo/keto reductase [Rhodocytophaga aerolata]|uniref:aldo/keto reductase n=1 Tax=Rhodocytophaga aerolata TaxID=455078 RepID=UPI003459D662